jgi:hypothetical protein
MALPGHDTLVLEGAFFASFLSVLLLVLILLLILRTRRLPSCGKCGFKGVRPSQPQGLLDTFARVCLLYPHRCDRCHQRFHCFRSRRVSVLPGIRAMKDGRRIVGTPMPTEGGNRISGERLPSQNSPGAATWPRR